MGVKITPPLVSQVDPCILPGGVRRKWIVLKAHVKIAGGFIPRDGRTIQTLTRPEGTAEQYDIRDAGGAVER